MGAGQKAAGAWIKVGRKDHVFIAASLSDAERVLGAAMQLLKKVSLSEASGASSVRRLEKSKTLAVTTDDAESGYELAALEEDHQLRSVISASRALYEQSPDWVTFFREILGVDGIVRKLYPTAEALAYFEQTPQYSEIQSMLAKLREGMRTQGKEPTRVITVRLPKSLHETLRAEAYIHETSINQLCISKLLQVVDGEYVPAEVCDKDTYSEFDEQPWMERKLQRRMGK